MDAENNKTHLNGKHIAMYLSTVNAVIVRTEALAEISDSNPWRMQIVSEKGYNDGYHIL